MDEMSDIERVMRRAVAWGHDDSAERAISQLNSFLQGVDWPPDSSAQGRAFTETFKRSGFQWFKSLCNRVSGTEINNERFGNTWKDFEPIGSWLDLASDPSVGPGLTRELMELLHPNGRLMSYVHSLSDPKRVAEHWAQCRRGQDPDLAQGNYIAYPYNCLPDHTQRAWVRNWRFAINGQSVPAPARQAAMTPIYAQPHWCPIAHDTPFPTENGVITDVMVTPFSYFMLRFGLYLWKRSEAWMPLQWLPGQNLVDKAAAVGRRVARGAHYVSHVAKAVSRGDAIGPELQGGYTAAGGGATEHKLVTMAEMQPGYALIFDMLQSCYVPAPEQPFLAPHTPPKFQKCLQEGAHGMHNTTSMNIPQYCSIFFVTCLDEAWSKWAYSLYQLVTLPNERFEPAKGAKGHEGVPCEIRVHEEKAAEDLHNRTIILSQPLNALLRAVQFHDFLSAFPVACMPHFGGGRATGLQKVILPQSACRDFRGSITQFLHITLAMANGRSGDVLKYPTTAVVPLLEVMALWGTLLSPYRVSSVRLPDAGAGAQPTAVCGHDTSQPPCLWWLHADLGAVHPPAKMHPVARFVRLFCAVVAALGEEVSAGLVECLPSRFELDGDVLKLEMLRWVRAHRQELSLIITKLNGHPSLLALADAAVSAEAESLGLSPPPRNASLALMYDAQTVLAGAGAPFLAEWELTYLSGVGRKPWLSESPLCLRTARMYRRALASCGGFLRKNVSGKTGPAPLSYANSWLWREAKDIVKAAVQTMSAGGAPFRTEQLCQQYTREHHEVYSALFTEFVEVLHSEYARNARAFTAAHVAAFHRVLACITHPVVSKALEDAPTLQHYLPADAWKASGEGLRAIEEKIACLCLDLRQRQRRVDAGAEAQEIPPTVVTDIVDMLISLHAGVPARLDEMEKMEKAYGYGYDADAAFGTKAGGAPGARAGSVQPYTGLKGLNEARLVNGDYTDGYTLSETGRAKVLSGGAPFEFRDFRQRGTGWVEVSGPESKWRNLAAKLPVEQKVKLFPYRRPAGMHELPWALKITQAVDAVIYRTVDSFFLQGYFHRGLGIRWINASTQQRLPVEVSMALEQAHLEAVKGDGPASLTLNLPGDDALEVDLYRGWAKPPGGAGFVVARALFDPVSTRFLAKDYNIALALLVLLYLLCYHSWMLWTLLLSALVTAAAGAQAKPIVRATPL